MRIVGPSSERAARVMAIHGENTSLRIVRLNKEGIEKNIVGGIAGAEVAVLNEVEIITKLGIDVKTENLTIYNIVASTVFISIDINVILTMDIISAAGIIHLYIKVKTGFVKKVIRVSDNIVFNNIAIGSMEAMGGIKKLRKSNFASIDVPRNRNAFVFEIGKSIGAKFAYMEIETILAKAFRNSKNKFADRGRSRKVELPVRIGVVRPIMVVNGVNSVNGNAARRRVPRSSGTPGGKERKRNVTKKANMEVRTKFAKAFRSVVDKRVGRIAKGLYGKSVVGGDERRIDNRRRRRKPSRRIFGMRIVRIGIGRGSVAFEVYLNDRTRNFIRVLSKELSKLLRVAAEFVGDVGRKRGDSKVQRISAGDKIGLVKAESIRVGNIDLETRISRLFDGEEGIVGIRGDKGRRSEPPGIGGIILARPSKIRFVLVGSANTLGKALFRGAGNSLVALIAEINDEAVGRNVMVAENGKRGKVVNIFFFGLLARVLQRMDSKGNSKIFKLGAGSIIGNGAGLNIHIGRRKNRRNGVGITNDNANGMLRGFDGKRAIFFVGIVGVPISHIASLRITVFVPALGGNKVVARSRIGINFIGAVGAGILVIRILRNNFAVRICENF